MLRKIVLLLIFSLLAQGLSAADTGLKLTQSFQFSCPTEMDIKARADYMYTDDVETKLSYKNIIAEQKYWCLNESDRDTCDKIGRSSGIGLDVVGVHNDANGNFVSITCYYMMKVKVEAVKHDYDYKLKRRVMYVDSCYEGQRQISVLFTPKTYGINVSSCYFVGGAKLATELPTGLALILAFIRNITGKDCPGLNA